MLSKYYQECEDGPDSLCVCCDNLFFRKSLVAFDREKIISCVEQKTVNVDTFMKAISNNSSELVCSTCKKYILQGKIPVMSANDSNLSFPVLPSYIRDMSNIEERMVSPCLCFMQIVALQPYAFQS